MLEEAIKDLNKALRKTELTINIQKTKVWTEPKPTNTKVFEVDDQKFETVRYIKYFGFILANDDNTTTDILQRFVTNDQICYGLKEQLSLL
jgi:hypothetical protein